MTILRRKASLFLVTFAVLGFAFGCGKRHVNLNPASSVPAVTAAAVLDIFVTAEDSGDVTQPTGQEVLRQTVTG
ncbi:MAG: hypothetical protein WAK27_09080 [Candidatus Sulfotelmatobacter sp.]|jgi:hypothetical protein